jgi:uridine kinase
MTVLSIGITGGTCSGKSTLAAALRDYVGRQHCVCLGMDSFYKQQPEDVLSSGDANFDHPEAFDIETFVGAVDQLTNGQAARVPIYDRRTSRIQGTTLVAPKPVLIVEGLFVFSSAQIVKSLDLAIFLDIDPAVQLTRRLARDVKEYGVDSGRVCYLARYRLLGLRRACLWPLLLAQRLAENLCTLVQALRRPRPILHSQVPPQSEITRALLQSCQVVQVGWIARTKK